MAEWSKNHRACLTTWSTLLLLHQLREVFRDAGALRMDQLAFWNPLASSELLRLQVTTLAHQIDNVFRQIRGAEFESGITDEIALARITEVLVNPAQTVSDLAAAADDCYKFYQEADDA